MRHTVVVGGTGFIGRAFCVHLASQGMHVQVITRQTAALAASPGITFHGWEQLPECLSEAGAVVNLAGEGLADHAWTPERRRHLVTSRVDLTRRLVQRLASLSHRPSVLVNASAIGFYGSRDETPVDESTPPGHGFLADLCQAWEAEALRAEELGLRVVLPRLGVVLAGDGGALPRLVAPIRAYAGAPLGSGRQGFSWIHRADLVRLLAEAIRNPIWHGPVNAVAPDPQSHATLMRLVARRLQRPLWPVPGCLTAPTARLLLGRERAQALVLEGAYVLPRQAEAWGFSFAFPTLAAAITELVP